MDSLETSIVLGNLLGPAAGVVVIVYVGVIVVTIAAWAEILSKAGYSGW